MSRGRPKEIIHEPKSRKYTQVFEDDEEISTWKYDLDKFSNGPIEVNIVYKTGAEKRIKERIKENIQIKRTARQANKITQAHATRKSKL